jgi:hypothetical protein
LCFFAARKPAAAPSTNVAPVQQLNATRPGGAASFTLLVPPPPYHRPVRCNLPEFRCRIFGGAGSRHIDFACFTLQVPQAGHALSSFVVNRIRMALSFPQPLPPRGGGLGGERRDDRSREKAARVASRLSAMRSATAGRGRSRRRDARGAGGGRGGGVGGERDSLTRHNSTRILARRTDHPRPPTSPSSPPRRRRRRGERTKTKRLDINNLSRRRRFRTREPSR